MQRHFDLDDQRRADLVLAVNEAVANAAEFGCAHRMGHGLVVVAADYNDADVTLSITISDRGRWRLVAAENHTAAAQPAVRGRGIQLMRLLADELQIIPSPHGTHISLVWSEVRRRQHRPLTPVLTWA